MTTPKKARGRPPSRWRLLAPPRPHYAPVHLNPRTGRRRYWNGRMWSYLRARDRRTEVALGKRGFSAMPAEEVRAIAARGGASHSLAHLRAIGRKGGVATARVKRFDKGGGS